MTDQLTYTFDELLADHPDLAPHVVGDVRLHGGITPDGRYQPPRAAVREEAIAAWERALRARGGRPFDADASLLQGIRMPNLEQQRVLLRNGLGQTFWNTLTITGKIEAKGRLLADATFPDFQPAIVEDISEMGIGHLNRGLLVAHGLDEGGVPAEGIGGHDVMWFVARDLAFGPDAYPDVEPPETIARPEAGRRYMPEIAPEIESTISFLANLLIIEFRAELGFADTQAILRTPDLFVDRRAEAELAAEIVERIRTDERIHVTSLCLYLGELRSVEFRTVDGGTVSGAELIDRFWDGLVRWATVEQPALVAERQRAEIESRIAQHPEAERVLAEFRAAGPRP
ncbi:MAG: hypothetical protein MUE78_02560 [Ilumatobacteraceae bacterium]|jgi:hypothetical protein|nr:hypothetical protein [Ilumatobacteraceae bacterium]